VGDFVFEIGMSGVYSRVKEPDGHTLAPDSVGTPSRERLDLLDSPRRDEKVINFLGALPRLLEEREAEAPVHVDGPDVLDLTRQLPELVRLEA
jgi:hypothetical protein